ncbi:transglutaminase-like domain-containing protein [Thiomicrorhabdus arctica]|uniref:transglutaminase-like domain-containing protein n=1 Tax=Thiomicrorhabdus arctica TaxID=131540 RepID=UPI00037128B9|nr:transglutaminase family protein [Thiomicrorhabdus arctica]
MSNKLNVPQNLTLFLSESDIINFNHPHVKALANALKETSTGEYELVKNCFEYVRDSIRHSGDFPDNSIQTAVSASDVLTFKTGWCYAKSHLLAALLRANQIPIGFCYQRLSCSEYQPDIFCLHGLNAVYLTDFGWYRLDPRGNKTSVNAQFKPPVEQLAFALAEGEQNIQEIYAEPMPIVINALKSHQTYDEMVQNLPDLSIE